MSKYGPFATIVALVLASVATIVALMRAVGAQYKGWRPPDSGLPGRLITGIFFVLVGSTFATFMLITPGNKFTFLGAGITLDVLAALLVPVYQFHVNMYLHRKPSQFIGNEAVDYEVIVGGKTLLPEALKKRDELKVSEELLLSGTTPPYDPDALWDKRERLSIQMRMSYLLMALLWAGVAGVVLTSFALQVHITNAPPSFSASDLQELQRGAQAPEEPKVSPRPRSK